MHPRSVLTTAVLVAALQLRRLDRGDQLELQRRTVTMTISNCALAGSYSGMAALTDFVTTDDTVVFALANAANALGYAPRLTRF